MAKLPIRWIEARTYRHATEDEGRVGRALDFALPGGTPAREVLQGHFGNELVRLTRRLEENPSIRTAWERWTAAGLLEALATEADARVDEEGILDRKSTRLNSSHTVISYAVFCLKKKKRRN